MRQLCCYNRSLCYVVRSVQEVRRDATASLKLDKGVHRLIAWYRSLPSVNIGKAFNPRIYSVVARKIEEELCFPANSVKVTDVQFKNFRKQTTLSGVTLFGQQWGIVKTYSDHSPSHVLMRAYREAQGCVEFETIDGIRVPKLRFAFAVKGKGVAEYTVIVCESVVDGMLMTNFLEMGAGKREEARSAFLEKAVEMVRLAGETLAVIHDSSKGILEGLFAPDVDSLLAEGERLTGALESRAFNYEYARAVRRVLNMGINFASHVKAVTSHRDYSTGNLLYSDVQGANPVGLIDLEKSERDFPGKDIANFTEALNIDGYALGFTLEELGVLNRSFVDGYLENTAMNRTALWRMVRFYQVLTVLSFMAYAPDNEGRIAFLGKRLDALVKGSNNKPVL
ncbi:MAG: phosphotransferase [Candidatus Saganbacteria bacterium]|nr:phosphotransferase [Candidatus Saganbacteria bacterium]